MHATMEGAEARQHQEAGIVGTSSTSVAGQRRCSHTHGSNLLVCPPLVTIPPTWAPHSYAAASRFWHIAGSGDQTQTGSQAARRAKNRGTCRAEEDKVWGAAWQRRATGQLWQIESVWQ